jgi:predicted DNA-binding transcriptional regulator AlpA
MHVTPQELMAARNLGEAIVQLIVAVEEGSQLRMRSTSKSHATGASAVEKKDKSLLTARETAKLLSTSEKTLWNMTSPRGPVPAIRFGKSVRYIINDVIQALSHHSQSSTGEFLS